MQFIKKAIKHTFLYEMILQYRAWKVRREWTIHDQEMFDFYFNFVSHNSLCFDIGANQGNRTKIFLKLKAKVVAVEPQADCVRNLRRVYGSNRSLTVVQKALGEKEGEAEMMISDAKTITSLSPDWIESVKKSGRFSMYRWDTREMVPMTTLDRLIEQYGLPSFIKIDVEGYEDQVIRGLSHPVNALSLEFTPEFIESTFKCIEHLQHIADIRLNYSVGESMTLALDEWVSPPEMVRILSGFKEDYKLFGDVYVRMNPKPSTNNR